MCSPSRQRSSTRSPSEIDPAPVFGTQIRVDFVRGVVQSGERFTVLLDLPRMFSADEVLDVAQRAHAVVARPEAAGEPRESGVVYFDD